MWGEGAAFPFLDADVQRSEFRVQSSDMVHIPQCCDNTMFRNPHSKEIRNEVEDFHII